MNRLIAVGWVASLVVAARADDGGWLTSPEKAIQQSSVSKKPILALFTGSDWCPPCKALEANIFSSPKFKTWARDHAVLLKLDYPRYHKQPVSIRSENQAILRKYQVSAFPTVLFLAKDGRIIGMYGYSGEGPSFWTKNAEIIIANGSKRLGLR